MTELNEEEDRIVCIPASQEPSVPSDLVQCGDCQAPLWRSKQSAHQSMVPICQDCLPADATPATTMTQVKELAEAWGSTPLDVANLLARLGIEIV